LAPSDFSHTCLSPVQIACSDGTSYSMDALEALDEAGYVNIVGVKGGYYSWFRCGVSLCTNCLSGSLDVSPILIKFIFLIF